MYKKILLLLLIALSPLFAQGPVLTLSFQGMTPHVGQTLNVRIVDKYDSREVTRQTLQEIPGSEFMMTFNGIKQGGSYTIDFYSDHNGNGRYDDPPSDHAWRVAVDAVQGDTTVTFSHNTNFTPLNWPHAVHLDFQSMNPHVGQQLEVRLVDKKTMLEISRDSLTAIPSAAFEMILPGIQSDKSYFIDFYSDHNGNKLYDAPPADHAWRLELEKPASDTTLVFSHNTSFVDIQWPYLLSLQLSGMTPHVGKGFHIRAIDLLSRKEIGRTEIAAIPQSDFEISVSGSQASGKYRLEFFADHNSNGLYDNPPSDHTWSLDLEAVAGNAAAAFQHNINFALLDWNYRLFLELRDMTPHLNKLLEARVVDKATGIEVGRKRLGAIYDNEITLIIPGIQLDTDYDVDFYADHNGNGRYDAPPTDHAWRETYNAGDDGDNDLSFSHNTNFVDISWRYNFMLNLTNMVPHLGQYFEVRLIDAAAQQEVGRIAVDAIPAADFTVSIGGLEPGKEYNADFFSDHNGNGAYDAPPVDHAWREIFTAANSDTIIDFTHNTNFVDIDLSTGISGEAVSVVGEFRLFDSYPNPFNPSTTISFNLPQAAFVELTIYNIQGQKVRTLVQQQLTSGGHRFLWDGLNENGQKVSSGVYHYRLAAGVFHDVKQMTLIK
ncbi:MAG: T9SS C-terminal target domain-containing protein [Calditrichaeota bacterium]|nr:MAG: T9SS C-terminal target domain-containing protein [Calditrichota bacterium]